MTHEFIATIKMTKNTCKKWVARQWCSISKKKPVDHNYLRLNWGQKHRRNIDHIHWHKNLKIGHHRSNWEPQVDRKPRENVPNMHHLLCCNRHQFIGAIKTTKNACKKWVALQWCTISQNIPVDHNYESLNWGQKHERNINHIHQPTNKETER